ncbi:VOC family protein [Niveispirillum fermenti]|uniref:VOC family protein n=1 Tax=Niveispirillum fermenti TaxID=1233113 RepID=UPI003A86BC10
MTANSIRGIDHIGLTVPDIASAERFLIDGLGAQFIYETLNRTMPPFEGPAVEHMMQGPPGLRIAVIRMYRMANGPGIELFQYDQVAAPRPALRGCDTGWQHVALYVDDMQAAIDRAVAAGAELLNQPWDLIANESGPGNRFCFLKAPFGALIELITFPSPQPYEGTTELRRWKPPLEKAS